MAKDYAGAGGLVPYFILAVINLYFWYKKALTNAKGSILIIGLELLSSPRSSKLMSEEYPSSDDGVSAVEPQLLEQALLQTDGASRAP